MVFDSGFTFAGFLGYDFDGPLRLESATVFAYQLEAGFGWNFRSNFNFSMGYRFFNTAEPEFVLSTEPRLRMDLSNHEFIIKLRYRIDL